VAALLRAAYELDARMPEPALELRRRGSKGADLLALRETADPDETGQQFPPADLLTEVAIELGRHADELVETGVVPYATAIAALRRVLDEEAGAVEASVDQHGLAADSGVRFEPSPSATEVPFLILDRTGDGIGTGSTPLSFQGERVSARVLRC
jgi:hypothetical protein